MTMTRQFEKKLRRAAAPRHPSNNRKMTLRERVDAPIESVAFYPDRGPYGVVISRAVKASDGVWRNSESFDPVENRALYPTEAAALRASER